MNSAEVLIKFKADTGDADKKIEGLTKSFTLGGLAVKGISAGIRTFNQNLGSAISRVDTLNNFVNVMGNLGVSAEDSEEAIDTLSKKLDGLPTTINEGALAVQRFTAANGNAKKSTDIYLALNNALLAGGASMEVQSNAMEQLNQAYAKGRPDAMEWRAMMTAMPGQLKQVAQSLGYTSTAIGGDLQKAIVDGNLSMDDFMEAFVKLNKEGTGNFKSFEEQAKASTSGINTGMKNMKTAIVRGMANAIQSVNKALSKYGGLAGVFKSIGKVAEKVFTTIGKIISKIIPYLVKVADWIGKHKKLILAILTPIASMVVAVKGVNGVLNTLVKLGGSVVGSMKNMIASFVTHPILTTTAAVAGLTAGIIAFISATDKGAKEHKKAMEDLKKDSEAIKQETDSWKDLKKTRDEALTTGKREIDNLTSLRNELYNIVDANGKVKKGYEDRASFIVNELSEALGIEISYKDGVIEGYQKIQEEIDKTIEKKKAEIILNASEEMYTEALKKQYKAEAKRDKLKAKLNEKQEQYNELMKKGSDFDKLGTTKTAKRYKKELDLAQKNYDAQVDLVEGYYFEIEKYDKNYEEFKAGHYDKMSTLDYENSKKAAKNSTDAKRSQMEAEIKQEQDHYNKLLEYGKKYGEDSIKNELDNSKKKLDALKKGLNDYDNETKTGLNNTKNTWDSFSGDIVNDLEGKTPKIKSAGLNWLDGLQEGLSNKNKKSNILTSISNLGSSIINGLKSVLKIHSPSREAMEIGSYFVEGIGKGINNEKKNVLNDVSSLGKDIISKANIMSNVAGNLNSSMNISGSIMGNMTMPTQPIINNINIKQDPLGRFVQDIKTFSGGAKNDYNYGKSGG